jgi:broad specificity phosphatase PhoE
LVQNPQKIWYGRLPGFHLSDEGKAQAQRAGMLLKNKDIKALYVSPLERTMETADIIASHIGVKNFFPDERLLEIVSPLQGCPEKEMEKRRWNHYTNGLVSRGGESIEDIVLRLKSFYGQKAREFEDQCIALVSHGEPMMITYLLSQNIRPSYAALHATSYMPTGSVFEFMVHGASSLRFIRLLS